MKTCKQRDCSMLPGESGWCRRHDPKGGDSDQRVGRSEPVVPRNMTRGSGGSEGLASAGREVTSAPGALPDLDVTAAMRATGVSERTVFRWKAGGGISEQSRRLLEKEGLI